MALEVPVVLGLQVHLDVGHRGPPTQEVVPDQPVEVEGGPDAGVGLDVAHRLVPGHGQGQSLGDLGGPLQGRALGHVHDELELTLVVEGEHLHRHQPQGHQGHRQEEKNHHPPVGQVPEPAVGDEALHEAAVPTGQSPGGHRLVGGLHGLSGRGPFRPVALHQPNGQVGRDDEGHGQARRAWPPRPPPGWAPCRVP